MPWNGTSITEVHSVLQTLSQYDATVYVEGTKVIAKKKSGAEIVDVATGTFNTDDATVIQAALDALADGGRLLIGKGTYLISAILTLASKSNVVVEGQGHATVIKQKNTTNLASIFDLTSITNCQIRNLEIDGNKANNAVASTVGILVDGISDRNVIEHVNVFRCRGDGISLNGATASDSVNRNKINHCHVEDVNGSGIEVVKRTGGAAARNIISQNYILDTGNHGIVSTGANYTLIQGNDVYRPGQNYSSGFGHGIAVDGNSGTDGCEGVKVLGNTVTDAKDNGAEKSNGIEVADGVSNVVIANNVVKTIGNGYGIYYGGALAVSQRAEITGNIVEACTGGSGIEVEGVNFANRSKDIVIANNECRRNGKHGILIDKVQYVVCKNNLCIENDQGQTNNDGIRVGSVKDVIVEGNLCYDEQGTKTQNYAIAVFSNTDVITNVVIRNNRTPANASGTISLGTVGAGSTITVAHNDGFVTEANLLSGTFAIDATGVKTVTIAHGLSAAPTKQEVCISVVEETDVDDWAFNLLKVESVDATNIVVKINVSTQSATAAATARILATVTRGQRTH